VFQVLEHASVCLTRIAEAFTHYPEKLDELCNHGLVAQAASLISVGNSSGQASLSTSTYTVCTFVSSIRVCHAPSLTLVLRLGCMFFSGLNPSSLSMC